MERVFLHLDSINFRIMLIMKIIIIFTIAISGRVCYAIEKLVMANLKTKRTYI